MRRLPCCWRRAPPPAAHRHGRPRRCRSNRGSTHADKTTSHSSARRADSPRHPRMQTLLGDCRQHDRTIRCDRLTSRRSALRQTGGRLWGVGKVDRRTSLDDARDENAAMGVRDRHSTPWFGTEVLRLERLGSAGHARVRRRSCHAYPPRPRRRQRRHRGMTCSGRRQRPPEGICR